MPPPMISLATVLASVEGGFAKLFHRLGVPDWACWTFLGTIVTFRIYRAWRRHTEGE